SNKKIIIKDTTSSQVILLAQPIYISIYMYKVTRSTTLIFSIIYFSFKFIFYEDDRKEWNGTEGAEQGACMFTSIVWVLSFTYLVIHDIINFNMIECLRQKILILATNFFICHLTTNIREYRRSTALFSGQERVAVGRTRNDKKNFNPYLTIVRYNETLPLSCEHCDLDVLCRQLYTAERLCGHVLGIQLIFCLLIFLLLFPFRDFFKVANLQELFQQNQHDPYSTEVNGCEVQVQATDPLE
ncbi:hypothetical protein ACJX0J_018719, partial [Zea mays]